MSQTLNYTRIPAPRVSLVDPQTGVVANEWFRFFNNLYTIAYSGTNTTLAGTYGSATNVAQITINNFGVTTALSNVPIAINANQVVAGTFNGLGFIDGTIDNSAIGSVTPSTGTFTTATASKYVGISGGVF